MENEKIVLDAYAGVGYSKSKVYKYIKKNGHKITQKQINEVLNKNVAEQVHKIQKKTTQGHITAFSVDELWQADLLDMLKYAKQNKGYKWILISVDVFTRQAAAVPIKSKGKEDMLDAMKQLILYSAPVELMSDNGQEFLNNSVQKLLNDRAVKHNVNTVGDHKALAVIDSFSRTLKAMIHKHFTNNNTTVWYDKLDDFLNIYNKNDHSGLPKDMAPDDTIQTIENEQTMRNVNEEKQTKTGSIHTDIKVGSRVRERIIKTFKKGTEASFSDTVYTVKSVARVKAVVTDDNGVDKSVRLENLQLINSDTITSKVSNPVKKATKDRKIAIKLTQEGVDESNVVDSEYKKGETIKVKIPDENGKKKFYTGVIKRKRGNKHLIQWSDGSDDEWLDLSSEIVKRVKPVK